MLRWVRTARRAPMDINLYHQPAYAPGQWYPPPPARPKPVPFSHALHLTMSIITAGFWLPIWVIMAISGRNLAAKDEREYQQRLDEYNRWMWQNYGPKQYPSMIQGPR